MNATEAMDLAKLKQELNVLTLRVRALELNTAKPPAALPRVPAEPQGVRISTPTARSTIDLPSEAEAEKIITVVGNRYPGLLPSTLNSRWADQDRARFSQDFRRALEWVSTQGRADEVDRTRYMDFWTNQAEEFFRLRGQSGAIGGGALLAAVIGAGDVKFLPGDNQGNVWAIALKTFGGRPATDAWRRVLSGQLLAPVAGAFRAAPTDTQFGVRREAGG